jgi:hypothetical protein
MRILWLATFLTLVSARAETNMQSGPQKVSLLELYTSEGCSSCPPAESWLSRLTTDGRLWKEIVPVAFHVDYWDDLGWKDRLAKQEYTARQRSYSTVWGDSSVYTPGFVFNGREWKGWFTGNALPNADDRSAGRLDVSIKNGTARIAYSANSGPKEIEAHIVPLAMDVSSDVRAGENRGRTLAHSFVALDLVTLKLAGGNGQFSGELPVNFAAAKAIAVWVTPAGSLNPLQATGGYLR